MAELSSKLVKFDCAFVPFIYGFASKIFPAEAIVFPDGS